MKIQPISNPFEIDFDNLSENDHKIIAQRLLAPFIPAELELRVGRKSGQTVYPLLYIDSRVAQHRLNKIFGVTGWSTKVTNIVFGEDTQIKKDQPEKRGLLSAVSIDLTIHKGKFITTKSDVGDQSLDKGTENKVTSPHAQALKRAASQLGINRFSYFMSNLKGISEDNMKSYNYNPKMMEEYLNTCGIERALKEAGFMFQCELTGEKIPWLVAAQSMYYTGTVISPEAMKKLTD